MPLWTLSQGTRIWSKPSFCISVRSGCNRLSWALAWLKPASCSPWRHLFNLRPVRMGFIVDRVALWQVFLPVFLFSSVSIIPPMLYTHSFIFHQHYVMVAVDFQETSSCYAFWLKCLIDARARVVCVCVCERERERESCCCITSEARARFAIDKMALK